MEVSILKSSLNRLNVLFLLLCFCFFSCGGSSEDGRHADRPSFSEVIGIDFYETRRAFDNGIAYDSLGFVQVPEWHLKFIHEDSIQVYSIIADSMFTYNIYHDHEDYFHFARESWKVIELHPDSLLLQRLSLRGLKVDKARSNVYMRFYSDRYIRDSLRTTVEELRKPRKQDSLFVAEMARRANEHPAQPDSAFASRDYVRLHSTNPNILVKHHELDSLQRMERSAAYEYLYPAYDITIKDAYKDFFYHFSVVIDEKGEMRLGKLLTVHMEEAKDKVVEGIIDVYLKEFVKATPAKTMGIPHASTIYLKVKGRAS